MLAQAVLTQAEAQVHALVRLEHLRHVQLQAHDQEQAEVRFQDHDHQVLVLFPHAHHSDVLSTRHAEAQVGVVASVDREKVST